MDIPLHEAPLSYVLLLVIPLISLYGLYKDKSFIENGLFHMRSVVEGKQYYRLLTPAFLHGSIGHLAVNMLTFYFFGPVVEYIYGSVGFAIIFIGSQLGAQFLTLYLKRQDMDYRALGASGAVSGIVFAFCVYAPMQKLYIFFAIPMPAIIFAALYVAYSTFAMGGKGRIAHEAHLGGAAIGALLALMLPAVI